MKFKLMDLLKKHTLKMLKVNFIISVNFLE